MSIRLQAIELKRIVKKLATVQSKSTTISFSDGKASAMDSDLGVVVRSNALFGAECTAVVNSKLFNSTVTKLSKEVVLASDGNGLDIRSAKFKGVVPSTGTPDADPSPSGNWFSLPAKELIYLMSFVSSVCEGETKLDHTGAIQLVVRDNRIELAATDNMRVALADCSFAPAGAGTSLEMMVPAKAVKVLREMDGPTIDVLETESALFFRSGDVTVFTKRLTKKFPPVKNVIPKSYKLEVEIKSDELLEALQRVAPAIVQEGDAHRVTLDFKGDTLTLKTGTLTSGQAEDTVDVVAIVPDLFDEAYPLVTAANHKFLCQYLTNTPNCSILFKANEPGKPFWMESGGKKILIAGLRV